MRILYTFFLLGVFSIADGQKILTVEDAVTIALKNNFDILVSRNDADIARVNNTPGNAGMLPSLQMTGNGTYGKNNVQQTTNSGVKNSYPTLTTSSFNAGAELSWTLFDGGKMFVTKNKLNEIENLGEIQFKDRVLQTLYNVIAAYYDIVRQNQELISINEVINYNLERVKIAETGFNAGSLLKTDLLQAKIDLNVNMENAISQQFIIDEAKRTLNGLLSQNANDVIEVSDSIPLNYSPDLIELQQKLNSLNTNILSYQKQIDIARLSLKEFNRSLLPKINLSTGYSFSHTTNSAGTFLQNNSTGPQIAGSIVIPLYSSGENKRKINTAKIQLQSTEYDLQNVKLFMNSELLNALAEFDYQRKLIKIEMENNELSKENIEISMQRLKLGQATSLEVHLAQDNYVQSGTRLINFQYNLKIAEIKLKQLIASL
jgi:outer membrane protein